MNQIEQRLQPIFYEAFGVETLDDALSIDTVDGWDSMAHVGLILALQKEFGVSISPVDALELTDVAAIKQFLGRRT